MLNSISYYYYWSGFINNFTIILWLSFLFFGLALLLLTIFPFWFGDYYENIYNYKFKKIHKKITIFIGICLLIIATTLIVLPSKTAQDFFISSKIDSIKNSDSINPSEKAFLENWELTHLPINKIFLQF